MRKLLTAAQAESKGYIIDRHAAGRPYAYKGSRFGSDHEPGPEIMTEGEEEIITTLKGEIEKLVSVLCDPDGKVIVDMPDGDIAVIQSALDGITKLTNMEDK